MTTFKPTFNPQQFELRGFTNPYLTEEQSSAVNLTESRVDQQLSWLAQLLGWSGPEYWSDLVSGVAQKRRVLGGSYGVYNSYIFPKVISIKNWDPTKTSATSYALLQREIYQSKDNLWIILESDDRIQIGQSLYIGDYTTTITQITESDGTYIIPIEGDAESILADFQGGEQVKVDIFSERPEPFYRPVVSSSGDDAFICGSQGQSLALYPSWDTAKVLPYQFKVLIAGSTYWFDQPVYLSKVVSRVVDGDTIEYPQDILSVYDSDKQQWYLTIPESLGSGELGTKAYIVWLYSNTASESFCVREIYIQNWTDPSDWNITPVLDNFTGAWGNKGGFLPFNFVFDSLEISGFDEQKSVYMAPLSNSVSFDKLLNFVYYQRISTDPVSPGGAEDGQVWWDSSDGSFSVWRDSPYKCGTWEEILYPNPAINQDTPERVYPDMDDFRFSAEDLEPGVIVQIEDVSGLTISDNIEGVNGTLLAPAKLKLYKAEGSTCWTPLEFTYADEVDFDSDAEKLPFHVDVRLESSVNLGVPRENYTVLNLKFTILEPLPTVLVKTTGNKEWIIKPTSNLKYIGNTRLFASNPEPVNGSMNWNYEEPDEELRRAAVYYYSNYEEIGGDWVLQGAWVDVNTGEAVDPPSTDLNFGTILVYCNGELVPEGDPYQTDSFVFYYEVNPSTGEFTFNYESLAFPGMANMPVIEISDSLTGVFRYDISEYVFSGAQYYISPNVLDSQTTLRLWKSQALQVEGEQPYLKEENFINVLKADQNNGPAAEAWDRYFVRLPPSYQRNGPTWQKVALVCQDFGYWGSSVDPEEMQCPSEDDAPRIYEQVFLLREMPTETYVIYSEPYLFSDVVFGGNAESADYENAAILPCVEVAFDQFTEGTLKVYNPLHERKAIVDQPVGRGYGDWEGVYLRPANCASLSGFLTKDILEEAVYPIDPPLWDASIYKLPPSCEVDKETYTADTNHFKIGYAYFVADLSCAEDGFFDIQQEAAWRHPVTHEQTLYLTPGVKHFSSTV